MGLRSFSVRTTPGEVSDLRLLTGLTVKSIRNTWIGFDVSLTAATQGPFSWWAVMAQTPSLPGNWSGRTVDPAFHSGAVRAYYRGIKGVQGNELLEIYLLKDFLPGYFWIFPLPDGAANVGFGC